MKPCSHFPRPARTLVALLFLGLQAPLVAAAPISASGQVGGTKAAASPADLAHQRGLDALARQDLAAAEAAFLEALKLQPRHVASLLGLGELAFVRRQLEQAGRHIDQALQVAPDDAAALASKGRLLVVQGQRAAAEPLLQRAAERDPKAVRPRIDLADLLASRGDHRRAIELYRQVVALDPQHAGARYAFGLSLRAIGQLDTAARELQAAVERAPTAALAHVELARTELQRKRLAEGLQAVEPAFGLNPVPIDAWLVKADLQEARGDVDGALQTLVAASQSNPRSAFPHLRRGMIEHQRGQLDAARQAYRRTLELDRKQPVALNNLAAIAVARKAELAEAEGWAREATRMNPRAAQFQHTLGEVLRAQGKTADALVAFDAAARLAPRDATLVFHHGRALAEAGQGSRAREVIRAALDLDSAFSEAGEARRLLGTL